MKRSGIYAITSPSGKRYIGSSSDIVKRWRSHRLMLRKGIHHNIGLTRASAKYGLDKLEFAVLEDCAPDMLLTREQWYLDNTPRQFNRYLTAGSPGEGPRGPHSTQTREKISAAQKGRIHNPQHLAEMQAARKGVPHTADARAKISAGGKGIKRSEEFKRRVSELQSGKVLSQETRERIGRARAARHKGIIRGVTKLKNGKFQTIIKHCGQQRYIGSYGTPELAYAMRLVYLAALPPGGV